jgi:hypothetical protein
MPARPTRAPRFCNGCATDSGDEIAFDSRMYRMHGRQLTSALFRVVYDDDIIYLYSCKVSQLFVCCMRSRKRFLFREIMYESFLTIHVDDNIKAIKSTTRVGCRYEKIVYSSSITCGNLHNYVRYKVPCCQTR